MVIINKSGDNFLSESSQQADKIDIYGEALQRSELDWENVVRFVYNIE